MANSEMAELMQEKAGRVTPKVYLGTVVVFGLLALAPVLIENSYYIHILNRIYVNVVFVVGLGLIASSGQLSLCHAAFAGIGGYTTSLAVLSLGVPPLLGILLGTALSGVFAFGIGAVTLRLRGAYFALVTFLFGEVFYLLVVGAKDITRGANGIGGIAPIEIGGFSLTTPHSYNYVLLLSATLTALFVWAIMRSQTGRALASVEQNIALAEVSGIPTFATQLLAFVIGSAIAGFGGAVNAHYVRFISPESYTVWETVAFIVMVVVGGRKNFNGWLVGAVFLTPIPELLRGFVALQHMIYGGVLVAALLLAPNGLITIRWRALIPFSGTGMRS